MARAKKADPKKKNDKAAKGTAQQPETAEQIQDAAQQPETAEQIQDTAQQSETAEQVQDAAQQPETAEQVQDAAQQPETAEEAQDTTRKPETAEEAQDTTQKPETAEEAQDTTQKPGRKNEKTSAEDAAKIEASVSGVRMEMREDGEITIEPKPDMFASLPNPCVYCGPSVKGVARQYTTYQGGITDALREFIEKCPEALGLIVSTGRFQAMRRQLEKYGTPEAELYKAVKERI